MNSKRGPNVDAREMLGNKNKNMDAREKLLKMRNLKVSFLCIILFHGFTPGIPFQKKKILVLYFKEWWDGCWEGSDIKKGRDSEKGINSEKGSDSKKEVIVRKGAIAKRWAIVKKGAIEKITYFHTKTIFINISTRGTFNFFVIVTPPTCFTSNFPS